MEEAIADWLAYNDMRESSRRPRKCPRQRGAIYFIYLLKETVTVLQRLGKLSTHAKLKLTHSVASVIAAKT